jgi:hypothetical protein
MDRVSSQAKEAWRQFGLFSSGDARSGVFAVGNDEEVKQ